MISLVLDTGAAAEVALFEGKTLLLSRVLPENERPSQRLLPLIRDCLDEAGLPLSRIGRIIVNTGPGSFTGIRVGLATAIGLNLGSQRPLIGVSAFEALAQDPVASLYQGKKRGFLLQAGTNTYYFSENPQDNQAIKLIVKNTMVLNLKTYDRIICRDIPLAAEIQSAELPGIIGEKDFMSNLLAAATAQGTLKGWPQPLYVQPVRIGPQ